MVADGRVKKGCFIPFKEHAFSLKVNGYATLSRLFHFLIRLFDWRRRVNERQGRAIIDVAFISNFREENGDVLYAGYGGKYRKYLPAVSQWTRIYFRNMSTMLFVVGSTAKEVLGGAHGKQRARNQFLSAVEESIQDGARVVLFASALKRLWSEQTFRKEVFPKYGDRILFTIGDNLTSIILCKEIERVIRMTGLKRPRVLVIGPSGFLGGEATTYLLSNGYETLGLAASNERVTATAERFGIRIHTDFREVGMVDLVVAASHFDSVRLTSENIDLIRRPEKKLVVIDPSEPYNLDKETYRVCRKKVIRVDVNAYSSELRFVLGWIASRNLRLTPGSLWACFCEAIILRAEMESDTDVSETDWMSVNKKAKAILLKYYDKYFGLAPTPLCFGKPISDFNV